MLKFNFFKLSKAVSVPEVSDVSPATRAEQEKMTRRAALRRIGMAGGMAILGTLTIDDLARVSAKKLQENEVTRGIGESLAKEFKDAGVAIADTLAEGEPMATGLKGLTKEQIVNAAKACASKEPKSAEFWECMAEKLGKDAYKNNWEYIYCKGVDPNGNNGSCPGFPNYSVCDTSGNNYAHSEQACCEARFGKCIAENPNAAGGCKNDLTYCEIQATG